MAKQNKPRGKRDKCVKMYVKAEELSVLLESSGRAGLSLSTFARRVCLAMQVKSREDQQARRELLKINADLGRLGGLLKQALASGVDRHLIHTHLREIDRTRDLLKTRVKGMA